MGALAAAAHEAAAFVTAFAPVVVAVAVAASAYHTVGQHLPWCVEVETQMLHGAGLTCWWVI